MIRKNTILCAQVEYGALRIVCKRRVLGAVRCWQNGSRYSIPRAIHEFV